MGVRQFVETDIASVEDMNEDKQSPRPLFRRIDRRDLTEERLQAATRGLRRDDYHGVCRDDI